MFCHTLKSYNKNLVCTVPSLPLTVHLEGFTDYANTEKGVTIVVKIGKILIKGKTKTSIAEQTNQLLHC